MARTVADQFANILVAAGVKRLYGIVGDSLIGLTDALRRQGKIEWIHVRHEEVAAFYRQFYPRGRGAKIAQVDVRGEVIGRRGPVDLGVVGDLRATIEALLPRLKAHGDSGHLDQARRHYKKTREDLDALAVSCSGKPPIHPQQVAKAISDHASDDAVPHEVRSTVLNRNSAHRDLQTARPHQKSEG